MAAGDLTTVESARDYLGLENSDDDETLSMLITAASAKFLSLSDYVPSAARTETLDGNGLDYISPECSPITAVASVTVDGTAVPARASVTGTGYIFSDDWIELVGYRFTSGKANVVIVYTAGQTAIPAEVEYAVKDQVAAWFKARDHIGISNQSVQGESVTYTGTWATQQGSGGLTPLFMDTVSAYREVPI